MPMLTKAKMLGDRARASVKRRSKDDEFQALGGELSSVTQWTKQCARQIEKYTSLNNDLKQQTQSLAEHLRKEWCQAQEQWTFLADASSELATQQHALLDQHCQSVLLPNLSTLQTTQLQRAGNACKKYRKEKKACDVCAARLVSAETRFNKSTEKGDSTQNVELLQREVTHSQMDLRIRHKSLQDAEAEFRDSMEVLRHEALRVLLEWRRHTRWSRRRFATLASRCCISGDAFPEDWLQHAHQEEEDLTPSIACVDDIRMDSDSDGEREEGVPIGEPVDVSFESVGLQQEHVEHAVKEEMQRQRDIVTENIHRAARGLHAVEDSPQELHFQPIKPRVRGS